MQLRHVGTSQSWAVFPKTPDEIALNTDHTDHTDLYGINGWRTAARTRIYMMTYSELHSESRHALMFASKAVEKGRIVRIHIDGCPPVAAMMIMPIDKLDSTVIVQSYEDLNKHTFPSWIIPLSAIRAIEIADNPIDELDDNAPDSI